MATMTGKAKWKTPYGSHAMTSSALFVCRVRMSDMLAPYNTDSSVGRRMTDIDGRYASGMNFAQYHDSTQERTGTAGRKT